MILYMYIWSHICMYGKFSVCMGIGVRITVETLKAKRWIYDPAAKPHLAAISCNATSCNKQQASDGPNLITSTRRIYNPPATNETNLLQTQLSWTQLFRSVLPGLLPRPPSVVLISHHADPTYRHLPWTTKFYPFLDVDFIVPTENIDEWKTLNWLFP